MLSKRAAERRASRVFLESRANSDESISRDTHADHALSEPRNGKHLANTRWFYRDLSMRWRAEYVIYGGEFSNRIYTWIEMVIHGYFSKDSCERDESSRTTGQDIFVGWKGR